MIARLEPNHLFQLPTFAEFDLPAGNDDEILDALSVDACADSVEMDARIELLKRLKKTAAEVVKELDGQAIQFENSRKLYATAFAESSNAEYQEKFRQAGDALQDLHNQISAATDIQRRLGEMIRAGEKTASKKFLVEFGARLRAARKKKKLTQIQIAGILNVTQTTYSSYENGTREPSMWTLRRLSKMLDVSLSWLFDES